MRPVPIPDVVREWEWCEGTAVFSAPDGDLTSEQVPPAEGIFYTNRMVGYDEEFPMVGVLLQLDDHDLDQIADGARHVLLSWVGRQMPVFVVPEILPIPPA
jgi:hypothetical protein